jgi:hypothetical protein
MNKAKKTYNFYIKTFSKDAPNKTFETVIWRNLSEAQARDMHRFTTKCIPENVRETGWSEAVDDTN